MRASTVQLDSASTPRMADHFSSLPYELRLHIYSYLHKPQLELDFCKDQQEMRLSNLSPRGRASPVLTYLQKRRLVREWVRTHGLHLLVTSRRLRNEYLQLVDRSDTSLTIHCAQCLDRLLRYLTCDLNLRTAFVKTIWMLVKIGDVWSFPTTDVVVEGLRSTMELIRTVLRANYGICEGRPSGLQDLSDRRLRSWTVYKAKVTGRVQERRERGDDNGPLPDLDIEEDVDDSGTATDDEMDNDNWSARYYSPHRPVEELERTVRTTIIMDGDYPDVGAWKTAKRFLEKVRPVADLGDWRVSPRLKREWAAKGKSTRKLRTRDELWLGVHMRP